MKKDIKYNKISLFQGKEIRKTIYQKEWWFSVVDVCEVLSESPAPRQYWEKVKIREFPDFQSSPNWGQLKFYKLSLFCFFPILSWIGCFY